MTREESGNEQDPWRPTHVYHYIQWKEISPDFVVDISNHINTKMEQFMLIPVSFMMLRAVNPLRLLVARTS